MALARCSTGSKTFEDIMNPENRWLTLALICMAALILFLYSVTFTTSYGRDLGQWENGDPAVREWYQSLMQPDNPTASCCGEADSYWCDDIHVRDGKTFC